MNASLRLTGLITGKVFSAAMEYRRVPFAAMANFLVLGVKVLSVTLPALENVLVDLELVDIKWLDGLVLMGLMSSSSRT
jgi:hypothetical protein